VSVLVVAEQRGGTFTRAAFEAVRAGTDLAKTLGAPAHVVALGAGIADAAKALGRYGAARVRVADHPTLAQYRGEAFAPVVAALAREVGATVVLLPGTLQGKDLGPQVAAQLGVGYAADCVGLAVAGGQVEVTRPVYAGKARVRLRATNGALVCTLRPNVFAAGEPGSADAATESLAVVPGATRSAVVRVEATAGAKMDLTEAPVIVSGGRGMKGPEHFALLEALAAKLGAVVGASRAVVDDGWRPHADQVGQTGKTVSPQLYIACGISGAIQHLAGMRTSKVIVAINKDREAPIFKVADYGIVGDVFEVVPALTAAL
jgi:electron transfer flavoprotein alpha subunit